MEIREPPAEPAKGLEVRGHGSSAFTGQVGKHGGAVAWTAKGAAVAISRCTECG